MPEYCGAFPLNFERAVTKKEMKKKININWKKSLFSTKINKTLRHDDDNDDDDSDDHHFTLIIGELFNYF